MLVPLGGDPVPTGQAKVGCFIGDHTRTGLGSMLNTGTALGVMCNVLPAGPLLPKHVPSFAAVLYGRVTPGFPLEQMFATATIVMGRRGQLFSEVEEQLYRDLYEQTRLERERTFQESHDHRADHRTVTGPALTGLSDFYRSHRWSKESGPSRAESVSWGCVRPQGSLTARRSAPWIGLFPRSPSW